MAYASAALLPAVSSSKRAARPPSVSETQSSEEVSATVSEPPICSQGENSEVFPASVAVRRHPEVSSGEPLNAAEIGAVAHPTVTLVAPTKTFPLAVTGAVARRRHEHLDPVRAGLVLSCPSTEIVPSEANASVITGKFWRLFSPVSPSPASFAVTPLGSRSIPSPALIDRVAEHGVARARVDVDSVVISIELRWMTLPAPAAVPPILLSLAPL